MSRIAVIGDRDSIYGFASLGLDIYPVAEKDDGSGVFRKLADGDYAVIYVTEELAVRLSDDIARYNSRITPAVITIPGIKGNTGMGIAMVKKSVERAVGSDIIFNDK